MIHKPVHFPSELKKKKKVTYFTKIFSRKTLSQMEAAACQDYNKCFQKVNSNHSSVIKDYFYVIFFLHPGSGDSDCTLEPVHQSGWICSWADYGDPAGLMERPCRSAFCSDHPFPWPGCSGDRVFNCNVPEAACVLVPHWENLQRPVWGLQCHFGRLLCVCG